MNKRTLTFPCLLLAILLWMPFASAAGQSGDMQVENRNYADAVLSFDAKLSGEDIRGDLFAVVFAESGQMKSVSAYPANETVSIALEGVAATDYVKLIWTDEQRVPLSNPAILRMSDNGSAAYAQFAEEFLKLQEKYGGGGGASSGSDDPYVLGRLLVSASELPDLSGRNVAAMIAGPDNLYILQFLTAGEAKECAEYLRTFPSVRYAEPDSVIQADEIEPTESARLSAAAPLSWGAEAAGLSDYAENLEERNVRHNILVAVVDSGADMEHSLLTGRLVPGYDFIDNDDVPQDGFGHGTHVAGIVADCTPGANVKIMPVRALDNSNSGSASCISSAIRYAADHDANIINLSLGLTLGHNSYLEDAIRYAVSKNITVIVAAGNQNADVKGRCPAHMEECVTVAAADRNWRRFELSNYGETVDIAAPGVGIYSSLPGEKYGEMDGTSMAAPHVSAAAALLMCERGTAQTPAQISGALRDSAASLDLSALDADGKRVPFGAGFLNLTPFIIRPQRTIVFRPNGGAGTMSPQSAASGSTIVLRANAFVREGFQFAGWNANADGSGAAYKDRDALAVTENLTLYAQWEPEKALYALLYADGELVFRNENAPNPEKTLIQSYAIPLNGASGEYAKWNSRRAEIQTVTFAEKIQPVSTALWLYGCENLTEIRGAENLDLSRVSDMSQMFSRCTSLETLDLSAWDTKSVTDMSQMFFLCKALTTIYASGSFDVSNVENSDDMFMGCTSLVGGAGTKFDDAHTDKAYARMDGGPDAPGYFTDKNAPTNDIYAVLYADGELVFQNNDRTESGRVATDVYHVSSSFDDVPWYEQRDNITTVRFADKILPTSTAYWFYKCEKLTNIQKIENLDTCNVTDMNCMFDCCVSLTSLDVSRFNTRNVTNMCAVFSKCKKLTALDVSRFDTRNVTDMRGMFSDCDNLASLDVSRFDTSNVTDMGWMFYNCGSLTSLDVSRFDTSNVTDMGWMFSGCDALTSLNVSSFNTANVNYMFTMFERCSGLSSLDVSHFDTSHVTDMSGMFYGCVGLNGLDVSCFNTSHVTNMSDMFYGCSSLSGLDVSHFDVSDVTDISGMFYGCAGLTYLDLSDFHTNNVKRFGILWVNEADKIVGYGHEMFGYCANLKTIYASEDFITSQAQSEEELFYSCTSLVGGAGTAYSRTHTNISYARIDGGPDAPGYFTLKDETANLSAEELFHLGEDYFNGANGKPQDYEKSRYYYQKSADKGNMYAINDLGYIYQKGYGVAADYDKAFALYSQAADMGNPHALNNLGYMYENGYGVAKDYQKALDYYQKAANAGSKMAAANLAALRLLLMFS